LLDVIVVPNGLSIQAAARKGCLLPGKLAPEAVVPA
jgi:hypothetical protein